VVTETASVAVALGCGILGGLLLTWWSRTDTPAPPDLPAASPTLPTKALPRPPAVADDSCERDVAHQTLRLATAEEALEVARFELTLAQARTTAREGKPVDWPADLDPRLTPEGLEPRVLAAIESLAAQPGVAEVTLVDFDCTEMPCLVIYGITYDWPVKDVYATAGITWGLHIDGILDFDLSRSAMMTERADHIVHADAWFPTQMAGEERQALIERLNRRAIKAMEAAVLQVTP
jgi:hypothetical protein